MKARMVNRFSATYPPTPESPNRSVTWFGTCRVWANGFPSEAVVTTERVMVINPVIEPCAVCGHSHVRLPAPTKES